MELDATMVAASALRQPMAPARTRVDARIGWSPYNPLELALVGQNLFDKQNVEFAGRSASVSQFSRVTRRAYATVGWRF